MNKSYNEFHISRKVRKECAFSESMFSSSGNVIFANLKAVQEFQTKLNSLFDKNGEPQKKVSAGSLNAMGLIDEIFHYVCMIFRRDKAPDSFKNLLEDLDTYFGSEKVNDLLLEFMEQFPPVAVYRNEITAQDYLSQTCMDEGTKKPRTNREQVLEELVLLHLANENPAFHPFQILFDDTELSKNADYIKTWNQIKAFFLTQPVFGPKNNDLISMLKEPVVASPTSLKGQLDYIRTHWAALLGEWLIKLLLAGMDTISEEEKAAWHPTNGGSPDMAPYSYDNLMKEYERFSPDREWMPKVVLMAKTVLVWLYQLSKKYNRDINRLDQIPDEELDALRDEGFTGLWLIGLWERSYASKRIKQINGNPEAAASAYSLLDYEIASNLGGWPALENLRYRCWVRGIRLASDMVPNHTGMDGKWVIEHPDLFITTKECPFPGYTFNGENLSQDSRVSIYLEDHYYSKSDCAVCFKRVDNQTGDVTYIYHGNDGTGMPWNDTAQIDFLNPEAREAVMQQILKVARNFPIIRFDAAMVLAKKHIRRLWYPEPGHGGDIASRSRYALSSQEFEARIPNEFWREVVDRCAAEMPDTLLLAEAFWMMEGYFTRTLGMHRVYNSAFMNMLKKEENQKYRDTIKNTIKFDPQILKRFVNFMNNPDEETAVAQFGRGDKYFGVCTLMITMPGLPMFGHGQLEGFEEKYGMEYTRAYKDEQPDEGLMQRHRHDIFPLLHKRYLFAQIENFLFYDVWNNGSVNENIFAYSNSVGNERTIVFYNNKYERASGWIKQSCEYAVKTGPGESDVRTESKSLSEAMGLTYGQNHFCIFREHKAGLWFVRKSDDIINGGMFVGLNGFEYQVYLDVQQVEDTADGKYAKLNELLNGSGTKDLDAAWLEYRYKELYASLKKFLTAEFISALREIFASDTEDGSKKKKNATAKTVCAAVKEAALEYYTLEAEFASKEISADDTAASQKKTRKTAKITETTAEQRFDAFCKQVEFLAKAVKPVAKDKASDKTTEANTAFADLIKEGLNLYKDAPAIIVASAAVLSAGNENCLKWGYTRKLAEILSKTGTDENYASNILERIFTFTGIRDMNFAASGFVKSTYETAKLLALSEHSGLLSGANEFGGTKWFNKERMEETLWYGTTVLITASAKILREQMFRLYRTLSAALEKSEYKCENFVESVKPKKVAKVTTKKASPAKTKAAGKTKSAGSALASKKSSKDSKN